MPEPLISLQEASSRLRTPEVHEIGPEGLSLGSQVNLYNSEELFISCDQDESNYKQVELQHAMSALENDAGRF